MTFLLLAVIYLAFISLGLPDSLLGAAWPTVYVEFGVDISMAGLVSMVIAGGTIVSSLLSERLINRFGTAAVTVISVAMTAVAIFGFSFSHSLAALCLWGIPYGLGAGSVDAGLNNYVALHYRSRHMSWLHCFWGVGATLGPYIMGLCLTAGRGWSAGYRVIGYIQAALVLCLVLSLPLWKRNALGGEGAESDAPAKGPGIAEAVKLPGAKTAMLSFFCYCSLETTAGLWASSYLVLRRGVDAETAAGWAALFYLGITAGRFICGFVTDKLGDKRMVRLGIGSMALGIALLMLPGGRYLSLAGLMLIGLGCAPVYPSLIHETPVSFGAVNSQAMIGLQMATAYVGTTFMPPLFGLIAEHVSIGLYPAFMAVFLLLMVCMTEATTRICGNNK